MPNNIKKTNTVYFITALLMIGLIFSNIGFALAENEIVSIASSDSDKDEIEDLNSEVEEKKEILDNLNKQTSIYKKKISDKQAQIQSLEDQLSVIENRIAKAELDIKVVKIEIESLNIELLLIEKQIEEKEAEIGIQKDTLAKLIRRINKMDQRTHLEVLLANDSFSEFFDQIKYLEDIQSDLQISLDDIQELKNGLEEKRALRETKLEQLNSTKIRLELEQADLRDEINFKEILIQDTESSEAMYQSLLGELKQEYQYIDTQVANIEATIRQKIEALDKAFADTGGETLLSWPADPSRGITAYFHDPTYPFRHLFEHSGIDLRISQGTPIKSAGPGYIVWAKQGRMYGNFVMIMHSNGISTVYAHLSSINVSVDQFVERGDVIGLSGGMPGTPGAGLSTGPHLHFEVRQNGIPTNPLNYLINQ